MSVSSCTYRKFIIPEASMEKVVETCGLAIKQMGLKMEKSASSQDGKTSIFAGERGLVPLTLKVLLSPLAVRDYVPQAQRTGIHVLVMPENGKVLVNICGIALSEISGRPAKYPEESMEQVTDTLEAIEFENKFVTFMKIHFPKLEEIG